jgi:hypothetical protein
MVTIHPKMHCYSDSDWSPRQLTRMSKSTTVAIDPLSVHSFRPVLVNGAGKHEYAIPVSIDLASLVLETRDTAKDVARQVTEKAKAAFESSVRALSSAPLFAVKGLPDKHVKVEDIFALTMGRAITSIAVSVMKGENVGNIACSGMQVTGTEATIQLADADVHTTSIFNSKRGSARGTLSPEVRASNM